MDLDIITTLFLPHFPPSPQEPWKRRETPCLGFPRKAEAPEHASPWRPLPSPAGTDLRTHLPRFTGGNPARNQALIDTPNRPAAENRPLLGSLLGAPPRQACPATDGFAHCAATPNAANRRGEPIPPEVRPEVGQTGKNGGQNRRGGVQWRQSGVCGVRQSGM
jgi:hypothetical protein